MKTIFFLLLLLPFFHTHAQPLDLSDTLLAKQLVTEAINDQQKGAFSSSNQKLQQAIDIYAHQEQWEDYLMTKTQVVRNYWRGGNSDTALILCNEILASKHLSPKGLVAAEIYSNLGVINDKKGNYDEALKYYQKCLAIRKEKLGNDHQETGKIYFNIGGTYTNKNELNKALEYFEYTLANFKQSLPENHPYFIFVYRNISTTQQRGKNSDAALRAINSGLEIANRIYPPEHFQVLQLKKDKIAAYSLDKLNASKSIQIYEEILPPLTKIYGEAHYQIVTDYLNLYFLHFRLNNEQKSTYYLNKTKQLLAKNYPLKHPLYTELYDKMLAASMINKTDSLSLQHCHQAILSLCPSLDDNLPIDHPIDYSSVITTNDMELSRYLTLKTDFLYSLKNKNNKYLPLYHQSLEDGRKVVTQTRKKISKIDDQIELLKYRHVYLNYNMTDYFTNSQSQRAYSIEEIAIEADQCKSMLLQAALSSNNALKFGSVPDSLIVKETQLKKEIADLNKRVYQISNDKDKPALGTLKKELFQLTETYNDLILHLEKNYTDYFQLKYATAYPSIETIQKGLLDNKTLLLNYVFYDNWIALFQITNTEVSVSKIPVSKGFRDTLTSFRTYLKDMKYIHTHQNEAYQAFAKSSHALYLKLLKNYIPASIEYLIIIPDKELGRIPFEVLLTAPTNTQKRDYKQLPYLIQHYTIRYAYSAALLLENQKIQQKNTSASKMVAFAASYPSDSAATSIRHHLSPLPGAHSEALLLQEKFQGDFYTKNQANEAQFNQINFSQYSVLHLAMHGVMDKVNPMNSLLALTEDTTNTEDDLVYAHELTNMSIPTNLVVLSACETGDGKIETVEGVMSIGRSFMYAGTPSIVMSLWQVNDVSTAKLMELFYNYLAQGLEKDVALRKAKLDYLELAEGIAAHPNFWAPFIQLGDNSPIQLNKRKNYSEWGLWVIGGIVGLFLLALGYRRIRADR